MSLFRTLFGGPSSSTSRINMAPESALEGQARGVSGEQLKLLQDLIGAGPGQADVTAGADASRGLASLLEQISGQGGRPSAADLQSARQLAGDVFAPEEQAVRAGFAEQEQSTSQLAARLGRQVNDPILRAKLAQEQTRQLGQVGARRTAFAAQEAQQAPMRQIGLAESLANVRGGLASQALANRQALFTLGQSALQAERQFRLGSASQTRTESSGGGLLDTIGGIAGGIGGLVGIGSRIGGLFGGGGGLSASGGGGGGSQPGPSRMIPGL